MGRAEEVLKGLASLREENLLCDVQLEAEGQQISAHKAVLAASSAYFKAMFLGKFIETREQVVTIKEVSFIGLRSVVEYIYSPEIGSLDMKNIEHVFPAAHLLQMNDIVSECVKWMTKNINKTNCFQLLEMAEKFSIENVEKTLTEFILKNFVDVSEMIEFEKISKPAVMTYLSSDTLKTNIDEFVAYKAARKWILANEVPSEDVVEIMSNIRFGLMKPDQIMKEVSRDPFIHINTKCCEMIEDAVLYHTNIFCQPLYDGILNKPRGEAGLLIIPTSDREEGYNVLEDYVDVEFVSFPDMKDSYLSSKLDIPIVFDSLSSTCINNFLYLFGVNGHGYQNFAKRYDASTNSWLELASVPRQATVGSSIAKSRKEIFLLGGMVVNKEMEFVIDGAAVVDSMHVYDISQNSWAKSTNLPRGLVYASAAQLQENIYLTGGIYLDDDEGESTLNKVWAYDMKAKVWLTKAPMNQRRFHHVLEAVDNRLFVTGGRMSINADDDNAKSIEMYDLLANQWTILLNNAYDNHACSSFVVSNKIYLVGGEESEFHSDVAVYDINKKKLSKMKEKLPSVSDRNVSAFIILPQLL